MSVTKSYITSNGRVPLEVRADVYFNEDKHKVIAKAMDAMSTQVSLYAKNPAIDAVWVDWTTMRVEKAKNDLNDKPHDHIVSAQMFQSDFFK